MSELETPQTDQADEGEAVVAEPTVQLEFEALPTMVDLDQLQVELDDIDRVLADLDSDRPERRDHDTRRGNGMTTDAIEIRRR